MAALLRGLAQITRAAGVVDVGAGSGYIGQALVRGTPPVATIGIEGSDAVHAAAVVREHISQVGRRSYRQATEGRAEVGEQEQEREQEQSRSRRRRRPKKDINLPELDLEKIAEQPSAAASPAFPHLLINGRLYYNHTEGTAGVMERALAALKTLTPGTTPVSAVLAGLHACGNLTPCILQAFHATPSFSALVCVGCCYNGLSLVRGITNDWFEAKEGGGADSAMACRRRGPTEVVLARLVAGKDDAKRPADSAIPTDNERIFDAMPMSRCLEQAMATTPQGFFQIDPFSMRRAASSRPLPEESVWRGGVLASMYRVVLNEVLLRPGAPRVDKVKTKLTHQQYGNGIGDYLRVAFNGAKLLEGENPKGSSTTWRVFSATAQGQAAIAAVDLTFAPAALVPVMEEMIATHAERVKGSDELEAYMVLQILSEGMLEDLMALDRCCHLLEAEGAAASVHLVPLFDEGLSPRSLALVAVRRS